MENRKPTLREIISSLVFIVFIGTFFILNFVIPEPAVLISERRVPAKFPKLPKLTVESIQDGSFFKPILDGSFMSKFDDYAADRFVFRDTFRGMHAFMVFDLYRQTDKSGLYRDRDVGVGEFKKTNETSFRQTTEKILKAAESLTGYDMNIYYSIIPDKSTFAGRYMPGFDLGIAEAILFDVLGEYEYIRIADILSADAFYKTDLHWNQSKIMDVANHLLEGMGANTIPGVYQGVVAGEFRGLYAGQLALPVDADLITYVDIPGLRVRYLSEVTLEFEDGPLYDMERLSGVDPYDFYLRGPQPLIVLENDNAPDRELYYFRDSFGSSLSPLLANSYSRITIIDLRYIHISLLEMFIDFVPGSDVLFMYGSQIFNNPSVLQT